ncbi:hypothetical protein [Massilia sp. PWRC2]
MASLHPFELTFIRTVQARPGRRALAVAALSVTLAGAWWSLVVLGGAR